MIVKNESHIIHEVLQATLDLVDTFCIVDTGSTDNTIKIIKDFYKKAGITGKVHKRPWVGFGENRSEALKLCDGFMDYIVMIDADDLMVYPKGMKEIFYKIFNEHKPNACHIQIKRGDMEYMRTQIFKANDSWRYVGVLHEYPTNDKKDNKFVKLPSEIHMIGRTMGARSLLEGNKYARDAEVLLKALETEPENERYVFYLAQSYRDAGNNEEAIKWYKKRYEMGKWKEEMYVSAYNIVRLTNDKEWVWKAAEAGPNRAEAFVAYCGYCRGKNLWSAELLAMAFYAAAIPKPTTDCLFIETDVYAWRALDELGIIAAYCNRKDVAKQTFIKLLNDKVVPAQHIQRIENNLKSVL